MGRSWPRPGPEHELGRPADGDLARRALRLLPGVVLLRHRRVRPQGDRGRRADLPLGARRGAAAHGVPARLRPPRPRHEPAGTKFCVAGTMSGFAAIVSRGRSGPAHDPGGPGAVLVAASEDGRYCFVSVARKDRVSVISFKPARRSRESTSAAIRSGCAPAARGATCCEGARRPTPARVSARLGHDPDVGPRRLPAVRIGLARLVVGHRAGDDHVVALRPVGGRGHLVLCCQLE